MSCSFLHGIMLLGFSMSGEQSGRSRDGGHYASTNHGKGLNILSWVWTRGSACRGCKTKRSGLWGSFRIYASEFVGLRQLNLPVMGLIFGGNTTMFTNRLLAIGLSAYATKQTNCSWRVIVVTFLFFFLVNRTGIS